MVGSRYYLSIRMVTNPARPDVPETLGLDYLLMILTMSVVSAMAVSSLNER
jgi:hypothetical protein